MSRQCPHPGCAKLIPDEYFMCGPHWNLLSPADRYTISSAYNNYLTDEIEIDALRTIQEDVLGRIEKAKAQAPAPKPREGVCRSCAKSILWVATEAGKNMPLDPGAVPAGPGTFCIVKGVAKAFGKHADIPAGAACFVSHFATCEHAAQHRKPG